MEREGQKDLKVQSGPKEKTGQGEKKARSQSMWDLWWTKWHCDRFFPEYFGFPLSISFHRCSIKRKNKEINYLDHKVANKP
jgi:hypothetical protein